MHESKRVFHFADPIEYLRFRFEARRRRDPSFSLSAWARRLGFENPSFLSQVLKRERRLKMNLVPRLARDLKLKGRSLRYFECLVLQAGAKTDAERRMYLGLAKQARPRKLRQLENLSPELFALAADWHYAALTESIHLAGFREDAEYLHRAFGGKLDRRTITPALDKLVEVGRLARDAEGKLMRAGGSANDAIFMRSSVPSEAIRTYHLQMLELARKAVTEQSVNERYLRGLSIPIREEHYARATEIIEDAHRKMLDLAAPAGADHVYQLNTQFFRLTAFKIKTI